ncbi:Mbeg1-like protein [Bradyrhizobium sp. 87]|uniref:lipase family protein n=1 Tax=Bradyrhizobium sp. 87 TaxID=2782682 RepID=UPI001FFA0014|nr:Mbeg1-like protein [Bradyrhizobium sp. 87]MCK1431072.1 DUF2974 domain-containing protein [Bradyrhizobium sp. 87]
MTTPSQILSAELALSNVVYGDNTSLHFQGSLSTPTDWKIIDQRIKDADGFFAEAFISTDKHTIIIAFQGSILKPDFIRNGSLIDDVVARYDKHDFVSKWAKASQDADVSIMTGGTPNAFKDALAFTKQVMDANPNATIYLTGHSLGGAEAEYAASQLALDPHYANRVHGDTFAAPGILGAFAPDKPLDTFTNFVDFGDPVGNFGGHYGQVTPLGNPALKAQTSQIEASALVALDRNPHPKDLFQLLKEVDKIDHILSGFKQNHDAILTLVDFHLIGRYETDITNYIASLPPPPHAGESLLFEDFNTLGHQTLPLPVAVDLTADAWYSWIGITDATKTVLQPGGTQGPLDFYWNTRDIDGHEMTIFHNFVDPTGGKALVSFDFMVQPGTYVDSKLEIMLDGDEAANIVDIIPAAGQPSGWQHVDIVIDTSVRSPDPSLANNEHTLVIWDRSILPVNTVMPTGFAVDNIQIRDFPDVAHHAGNVLFSENFDDATTMLTHGWTGTIDPIQTLSSFPTNIIATSGTDYLETIGIDFNNNKTTLPNLDISHTFVDPTGGQVLVSMDIAAQNFNFNGTQYATDNNIEALQFTVDGVQQQTVVVGTHGVGYNKFSTVEFVFDTGVAGSTHALEIKDISGGVDRTFVQIGFAVDTLQIHDLIV